MGARYGSQSSTAGAAPVAWSIFSKMSGPKRATNSVRGIRKSRPMVRTPRACNWAVISESIPSASVGSGAMAPSSSPLPTTTGNFSCPKTANPRAAAAVGAMASRAVRPRRDRAAATRPASVGGSPSSRSSPATSTTIDAGGHNATLGLNRINQRQCFEAAPIGGGFGGQALQLGAVGAGLGQAHPRPHTRRRIGADGGDDLPIGADLDQNQRTMPKLAPPPSQPIDRPMGQMHAQ